MGGTYDLTGGSSGTQLKFNHGGSSGAPLTLESYPGQTATLTGGPVYVPNGSDYVDITHLDINTHGVPEVAVQIMGAHDQLTDSDITNLNSQYSCIILGSDTGYGQAVDPLVSDNVVHQCGYNPSDPFEDHGVYDDNTVGAIITSNIFWGMPYGFGVQLYPNAQGSLVARNVIDNNGNGVIFGGNTVSTSNNNTVTDNIITNSSNEYDIQSWWGGAVGSGNVANNNCVYSGNQGEVQSPTTGFTASGNVIANASYVNQAAHTVTGYELQAGSPCLAVVGSDPAAAIAASLSGTTTTPTTTTTTTTTATTTTTTTTTPPPTAPATPTGLTATANNGSVTLRWSANAASDKVTGYNVYRIGQGFASAWATTSATTFTNSGGVTNGTQYCYQISATNAYGTSPKTAQVCATPKASGPPATPAGLTATANVGSITLRWTANPASDNVTSYSMYRVGQSFSGPWATTSGTTITNGDQVKSGTRYCYQISATNAFGTSPLTAQVCATAL